MRSVLLFALASPSTGLSISPIFERPTWPKLAEQLDRLPLFTIASEAGDPLRYNTERGERVLFYADIEAAKTALEDARPKNPDCDLIPVGVGSAYKLACEGQAEILPARIDLTAAGAPVNSSALGQDLPLFACMEMSQESESGSPVLPLFMSWSDCATAVSQATAADSPEDKLEIVGLSLPSVLERLGSLDPEEESAFTFIPPSSSTKYIGEYLGTQDSGGI